MHISKHLHSCLLIEDANRTVLIDPGIFTYQEKSLDLTKIKNLDYLLITHEHPDHMHMPLLKTLVDMFPTVTIISNQSVVQLLQKNGLQATAQGNNDIRATPVPHERVFDKEAPQNVLFDVFNRLTHPGDAMNFTTTKEVLALPLLGPSWMITQAAEKAVALEPKIVLPIHDYQWRDAFRKEYYKRLKDFFAEKEIDFKPLEANEKVEI